MNKWEPFEEFVKRLYFDTTVYGPGAMEMLVKVVGVDNIVFASEMLGGVTTVDPHTGRFFDDNKPFIDALGFLSDADRRKISKRTCGRRIRAWNRSSIAGSSLNALR